MSGRPRDIDCGQAAERLYEYLDRELTPDLRSEVEYHLKACAGCFHHFGFEEAFLRFLQARTRGRGADPELKRRIIRELFGPEGS